MINLMSALEFDSYAKSTTYDRLIKDIAQGDKQALNTLYNEISKSVYGFALSITKNTYDAEDVLQETFITIYRKAQEYQPREKPMAWIFTIARNYALMKIREQGKTAQLDENQIENSDAFDRIENVEQKALLQALLKTLNDNERQIVMLHTVGKMKNREIGELLKLPVNTVLSIYHRAIKKLRESMEREAFYNE